MNQDSRNPASYPPNDDIDFVVLFKTLWSGKWLIVGTTAVFSVAAVVLALSLPNIYRSEALLAPSPDEGAGGLSALAAQYGGLASLAGINLRRGSTDKVELGLEILKSRKFIEEFIARHDILVPVMASKGWNEQTGELIIDPDVYDRSTGEWVRSVAPPRGPKPSLQEASEVFKTSLVSVGRDNQTGFVTIGIEFYSPRVAKQWVDWLVSDLNETVMRREVDEALQAVEYLEEQIRSTALADLQSVFYRLIEDQTKTIMLANVTSEYLLRTIDPAAVPELKIAPRRSLIAIVGFLLGGLLGAVVVLVRNEIRSNRSQDD